MKLLKKILQHLKKKPALTENGGTVHISLDNLFREYERELFAGATTDAFMPWLNKKVQHIHGVRFETVNDGGKAA